MERLVQNYRWWCKWGQLPNSKHDFCTETLPLDVICWVTPKIVIIGGSIQWPNLIIGSLFQEHSLIKSAESSDVCSSPSPASFYELQNPFTLLVIFRERFSGSVINDSRTKETKINQLILGDLKAKRINLMHGGLHQIHNYALINWEIFFVTRMLLQANNFIIVPRLV